MGRKEILLNHDQIEKKIKRISFELYEKNYENEGIILLGITNRGYLLAEIIYKELKSITDKPIHLGKIFPSDSILTPAVIESPVSIEHKNIVVIDDVLNTGKTLMYAVKSILNHDVQKLMTLVLIDRKHGLFPIKADIAGLTLSTTLQDHIEVEFSKDSIQAFIS